MNTESTIKHISQLMDLPMFKDGVKFDTPVSVKASPHSSAVTIWEVRKSPKRKIYVRCGDGECYELEAKPSDEMVASSVLQRLKYLSNSKRMHHESSNV